MEAMDGSNGGSWMILRVYRRNEAFSIRIRRCAPEVPCIGWWVSCVMHILIFGSDARFRPETPGLLLTLIKHLKGTRLIRHGMER